jgi:hypothetical protein
MLPGLSEELPMATHLTPEQMKQFVRDHFEDFVNKQDAAAIKRNVAPDFFVQSR